MGNYKIEYKAQDNDIQINKDKIKEFYNKYQPKPEKIVEMPEFLTVRWNFGNSGFVEVHINLRRRAIYKVESDKDRERSNMVAFKNNELQFFDNLGYNIDDVAAEDTGQEIEDWF